MSESDIVERLLNRGVCSPPQNSCRNDWICEEAAAEIERLRALMTWQPIETAPKDGRRIIAYVDDDRRIVAWTKTSHVPLWGWCFLDQGPEDCDLCAPTHWMPLPDVLTARFTGKEFEE